MWSRDFLLALGVGFLLLALNPVVRVLEQSLGAITPSLIWFALAVFIVASSDSPIQSLVGLGAAAFFLGAFLRYNSHVSTLSSSDSAAYASLRRRLLAGGSAAQIYRKTLEQALAACERFFGDAGMPDQTLLPHVFGLKTPVPLWTSYAFNRCLLLAFAYPIAAVFLVWAISGNVGPAEAALRVPANVTLTQRSIALAAAAIAIIGFRLASRFKNQRIEKLVTIAAALVGSIVAVLAVGVTVWSTGLVVFVALAISVSTIESMAAVRKQGYVQSAFNIDAIPLVTLAAFFLTGSFVGALSGEFGFVYGALILACVVTAIGEAYTGIIPTGTPRMLLTCAVVVVIGQLVRTTSFAIPVAVILAIAGSLLSAGCIGLQVGGMSKTSISRAQFSSFLNSFYVAALWFCFVAPLFFSAQTGWQDAGPLLLFLGTITLINAPFNWASLGLTRALLWRGLEKQKLWPYFYALVDGIFAVFAAAALACMMVVGMQAYNELAVAGGGKGVFAVNVLISGIRSGPLNSEYWWVYFLLISTMLPSIANLIIGGLSLTRGIPLISNRLLSLLPEHGSISPNQRRQVAFWLSTQEAIGAALAIFAQAALVFLIFGLAMPRLGIGVLDLAESLVVLDIPALLAHGSLILWQFATTIIADLWSAVGAGVSLVAPEWLKGYWSAFVALPPIWRGVFEGLCLAAIWIGAKLTRKLWWSTLSTSKREEFLRRKSAAVAEVARRRVRRLAARRPQKAISLLAELIRNNVDIREPLFESTENNVKESFVNAVVHKIRTDIQYEPRYVFGQMPTDVRVGFFACGDDSRLASGLIGAAANAASRLARAEMMYLDGLLEDLVEFKIVRKNYELVEEVFSCFCKSIEGLASEGRDRDIGKLLYALERLCYEDHHVYGYPDPAMRKAFIRAICTSVDGFDRKYAEEISLCLYVAIGLRGVSYDHELLSLVIRSMAKALPALIEQKSFQAQTLLLELSYRNGISVAAFDGAAGVCLDKSVIFLTVPVVNWPDAGTVILGAMMPDGQRVFRAETFRWQGNPYWEPGEKEALVPSTFVAHAEEIFAKWYSLEPFDIVLAKCVATAKSLE